MKRILLSCLLVLVAVVPAWAGESLLFLTDQDFAPYSMIVAGQPSGIDVDVLSEAAKRSGLDLTIKAVPLKSMLDAIRNGSCDGAVSLFRSPDREQFALFMEAVPVHLSDYVLFTKVGNRIPFAEYQDLKGKVIGYVGGVDLGPDFEAARKQGDMLVKEYRDLRDMVAGLLGGEIDAFAGNIDVTYYRLKDMGLTSTIVYLPRKILTGKPSYAVLSRASALKGKDSVAQKLEKALDDMHKDGTYNTLARHYLIRF
ncbi:substrate-binding periplasmic protein [Pseudodesulfovibrio indicus]|uniref:ABC transporter substrate-binding protein n=1 Tax=Pseudodesulfovibrio indicus TaxID=1716143 RepID=A0A126QK56_9BACT|nr:transporter substrate-binding domain-containing protein [Pseudodesulfovibrio indicus]AMK10177.1 ABC transporter substrate-binding protein [Pseudodesulfovibrio indicus]TDT87884.1 amino acid ABC transporter substrate-binding protein (PAAT family) [Pseudodesulfovibrio indicus]